MKNNISFIYFLRRKVKCLNRLLIVMNDGEKIDAESNEKFCLDDQITSSSFPTFITTRIFSIFDRPKYFRKLFFTQIKTESSFHFALLSRI